MTVFEAAPKAGGQIRLTALSPRRREMISIIDWRLARCEESGVVLRFNTLAEASAVLSEKPDVVIIATGGLPHTADGIHLIEALLNEAGDPRNFAVHLG